MVVSVNVLQVVVKHEGVDPPLLPPHKIIGDVCVLALRHKHREVRGGTRSERVRERVDLLDMMFEIDSSLEREGLQSVDGETP
jgi:hypothetical protein